MLAAGARPSAPWHEVERDALLLDELVDLAGPDLVGVLLEVGRQQRVVEASERLRLEKRPQRLPQARHGSSVLLGDRLEHLLGRRVEDRSMQGRQIKRWRREGRNAGDDRRHLLPDPLVHRRECLAGDGTVVGHQRAHPLLQGRDDARQVVVQIRQQRSGEPRWHAEATALLLVVALAGLLRLRSLSFGPGSVLVVRLDVVVAVLVHDEPPFGAGTPSSLPWIMETIVNTSSNSSSLIVRFSLGSCAVGFR